MKLLYDGHEYSFNDSTGELKNNYGEIVATIEDDETGEYYYIDLVNSDIEPPPFHVNAIKDSAKGRAYLVLSQYVGSE